MIRLAVSNLAWPADQEAIAFDQLAAQGAAGVEVAPTRLAGWDELTAARLADYRARIEGAGLVVSSLQAILFGRNDVHLLEDEAAFERLASHLGRVAGVAAALGAGVLVFGSPRNRLRGERPLEQAWDLARQRFGILGRIAADAGVVLGIEPVPAFYGGDFLTSWPDVLRMVEEAGSPDVRVHLDTGCVLLGNGSIAEAVAACRPLLAHFHAAQPDLASFATPTANHAEAAEALRASGYDRWIAIEMREQTPDPLAAIATAVAAVKDIYGLGAAQSSGSVPG